MKWRQYRVATGYRNSDKVCLELKILERNSAENGFSPGDQNKSAVRATSVGSNPCLFLKYNLVFEYLLFSAFYHR
jgi:hypothetical protein